MAGPSELERRCVAPFYLKMMRLNALSNDVPVTVLREVARETTDEEVAQLLAGPWRPRVMGAWLAAGRAERLMGSASYAAAILERLDAAPRGVAVGDQDRQAVQQILALADRLAGDKPEGAQPTPS